MIQDVLKGALLKAAASASFSVEEIELEHPNEFSHGDYASNVALVMGKREGKDPKEIAEKLTQHIVQNKPDEVEKVEVAGAGFINFHLSSEFFAKQTSEIIKQGGGWGENEALKGKKVMVEYTDPNPLKVFHIGHLMSNAIGESLSRLIEFSGAEVKHVNYQGDVGLHVANALWGKMQKPKLSWGEAYAYGTTHYKDHKEEIDSLNKTIYERSDDEINKLFDEGRKESLDEFEVIYKKLGTVFDYYFFESEVGDYGKQVVEENVGSIFEDSDGAVIFRGEKYGLHTRVFVNSQGLPTYEAKELGLAKVKYDAYPYDLSYVVTANEITTYFHVLLKAMEFVFSELAKKTTHVPHGIMKLASGKMSSRTGTVITAGSLIGDVQKRVRTKMDDSEISDREAVAEQVAVSAIKYSILKQATGKDIVFDLEKSLSFEGDSGPYLQYANTRARSVLAKAGEVVAEAKPPRDWDVTEVERLLYRFPEVARRAQEEKSPHFVTVYLTELAGAFNSFYANEKILDGSDGEAYKLALTSAVSTTLQNGLWLLGIKAPERM